MIIRPEQIESLARAFQSSFCGHLAGCIRREFPEVVAGLDKPALEAAVGKRIDRAMTFGLSDLSEVRRYVECSYALAWPEADVSPDALEVLRRSDLTLEERLDVIEQWTDPARARDGTGACS